MLLACMPLTSLLLTCFESRHDICRIYSFSTLQLPTISLSHLGVACSCL